MKKLIIICGLLLSINAHAGFLLGMMVGSAMSGSSNNQNANSCIVELKPDEIICETNTKLDFCYAHGDLNKYVREIGYGFYHRQAVCYTGNTRVMVVKVWNK